MRRNRIFGYGKDYVAFNDAQNRISSYGKNYVAFNDVEVR